MLHPDVNYARELTVLPLELSLFQPPASWAPLKRRENTRSRVSREKGTLEVTGASITTSVQDFREFYLSTDFLFIRVCFFLFLDTFVNQNVTVSLENFLT